MTPYGRNPMKKIKEHIKQNADNIKAVSYATASLGLITAATIIVAKQINELKDIAGAAITVVHELGGTDEMILEKFRTIHPY
jgi:hypothetical protein